MQDWQEESRSSGHPIRAWVLEGNSAFKHLTQYDHSRRFKQQWPQTSVILHKTGMNKHGELNVSFSTLLPTAVKLFSSAFVVGGFVFVFSGALFWLAVLSRWPLSLAYPLLSISYIIGISAAVLFLKEKVTLVQLLGVLVIMLGVFLVSRGAEHQ